MGQWRPTKNKLNYTLHDADGNVLVTLVLIGSHWAYFKNGKLVKTAYTVDQALEAQREVESLLEEKE